MKNTAWQDGDDEIQTYTKESQATKYLFFGFLILVAVGFIVGDIILSTL